MKERPSSGIWPQTEWGPLLRQAGQLLKQAALDEWSFGGGSAMAFHFNHRISYDVDIFVNDPQYLGSLSPRLNDISASLVTGYYEASNSLKLTTENGDIDFIVVGDVTSDAPLLRRLDGFIADIRVQTPAEILAKKIQYRGTRFTHRDIFDLAMLMERDIRSVDTAIQSCSEEATKAATAIISKRLPAIDRELPHYVNPTSSGTHLVAGAAELMQKFIQRYKAT